MIDGVSGLLPLCHSTMRALEAVRSATQSTAAQQSISHRGPRSDDFHDQFLKDKGNAIMAVPKERDIAVRSKWRERKGSPNTVRPAFAAQSKRTG